MKLEDYFKYYIQGSDHYLIPKDVFKELFNEMVNWREEVKELKKQLEDKENIACNWKDSCLENAGKIEKLQNNWNELKKWLGTRINTDKGYERNSHIKEKLQVEDYVIKQVMFFMQELEGKDE